MAGPIVRAQTRISPGRAEFFGARMATHDIGSIDGYFTELRRFTMLSVAWQITCRTLIIEAENDFAGGSGQLFRGALTAPAELVHVTRLGAQTAIAPDSARRYRPASSTRGWRGPWAAVARVADRARPTQPC